jgi:hypothetical protein
LQIARFDLPTKLRNENIKFNVEIGMIRIMDERVNGMNRRDGYKVELNGTNWDEVRNKNVLQRYE